MKETFYNPSAGDLQFMMFFGIGIGIVIGLAAKTIWDEIKRNNQE